MAVTLPGGFGEAAPRAALLGSRIVSGALTATILMALIFGAAIAFFGVRIDGSVAGFVGVLLAFAALFALLAIWRFDWEEPAGSA
ncbi:hypothetical protein [Cupriavidus basilensis]|uniref:Uncharacterized protein n=1 Tax=Cupriavidus basilensis TaxID=68895 RepID=A0A0C4YSK0_9BURK|nr:hypothetical protein [Cupriavidus basilensis]AJG24914.1 hypothetical protein RR42_s3338 [Cupriavidus basilensis]